MTEKQKDLLYRLLEWNILVYVVIGFLLFGLPLVQERLDARATAIALQQTAIALTPPATSIIPTFVPTPPPTAQPIAPTRVSRPPNVPAPAPVALAIQDGESPSNPAAPKDAWQTLNAGANIWYKLGNGGDHIDAFLEAKPIDGITMQIFAPGNLQDPIGQGTYQKSSGQLVWSGGKWDSSGNWIAKIINSNSGAVQYKVTANASPIPPCDSISYWEKIHGQNVYWTRCK